MTLKLIPFEEKGILPIRWWRNTIRPLQGLGSLWSEVYRGESLLAPLGFAYLWILLASPLLVLTVWAALNSVVAEFGQYSGLVSGMTLLLLPGTVAIFILGPLLMMFIGGCVAHGLLRILDPELRGQSRGTLRVFGYVAGWMAPILAARTLAQSYFLCAPMTAFNRQAMDRANPSPFFWAFIFSHYAVSLVLLAMLVWGLAKLHRTSLWKALSASVLALVVLAVSETILISLVGAGLMHGYQTLRKSQAEKVGVASPMHPKSNPVEVPPTVVAKPSTEDPQIALMRQAAGEAYRAQMEACRKAEWEAHWGSERGDPEAMVKWAFILEERARNQQSADEVVELLMKARQKGARAPKMYEYLAWFFEGNNGGPKNLALAEQIREEGGIWQNVSIGRLQANAQRERPAAMGQYGLFLFFGQGGVKEDKEQGRIWVQKAVNQGWQNRHADRILMTPR